MKKIIIVITVILQIAVLTLTSEIKEQVSLAVTVYNDQFAIVKDVRSISFDQGRSDLYFTDVSSNIQTQTVTFKALNDTENIKIFQQNYEANLINSQSILQKYIDKDIQITVKVGEQSKKVNGTLLGYNSGYIINTNEGIEVFNKIETLKFSSLPAGFLTLPTLNWKVYSQKTVTTNCEVAYRTTGFSWKSDYSIVVNGDQTKADVGGWVTIKNFSGKRYKNAKLKLIAGDVNTVSRKYRQPRLKGGAVKYKMNASAPTFSQKSFSDYHMYTLSESVTLEQKSEKQVEFISKVYGIGIRKFNLISISSGGYSEQNIKPMNKIEISNTEKNKLGVPLPKGTVRVFKEDETDGSLEFIGQDSIQHTPKDENITISIGNAFDITANKLATSYQNYNEQGFQADLNLTIWNRKSTSAQIVVEISNNYGDNDKFIWKTADLKVEKVTAKLIRISRVFKANQKMSYLWSQKYRS